MAGKESKSPPVLLLVMLGFAVIGGALYWYLEQDYVAARPAPLSSDAKSYVKNLKLSEVEMKASESYMKQTIVEINGKISNLGDRSLSYLEINCVFYDAYGQVVLREPVAIVKRQGGGIKPGETKSFRLPFDKLPESWNQSMPQLVIAQIVFG